MHGSLLGFFAVVLALPLSVFGATHGSLLNRQHHALAKRAENVTLYHRASNARMSFYDVETGSAGSCGVVHKNSDFTVALSASQMNPSLCFKQITISYNGKSTTADISDTCPGCPGDGLDLTEGLFEFFAPQSAGLIYANWEFAGAAAPAPPPPPPPPPPAPSPTSTYVPPPTSSAQPSSSAPVSSAPASSSVVSSASAVSSSGSPAVPTTSSDSDLQSNLAMLQLSIVHFGALTGAAAIQL